MSFLIDLNSDLGEHPNADLDEQIMSYISSCNIACGGHAGDEKSVNQTVDLALSNKVVIGAHPSFPDMENFGRKVLSMDLDILKKSLQDQILLVRKVAEEKGGNLHHVKPHGALYNYAASNYEISEMIVGLILEIDPHLKLYGLAHSEMEKVAKLKKISFVGEAFADRKYEIDGSLRSRAFDDAVLTEENQVLHQVEELVLNRRVRAEDWITISAQTICLHSDTKGSVNLAKAIRQHLEQKGVHIRPV